MSAGKLGGIVTFVPKSVPVCAAGDTLEFDVVPHAGSTVTAHSISPKNRIRAEVINEEKEEQKLGLIKAFLHRVVERHIPFASVLAPSSH